MSLFPIALGALLLLAALAQKRRRRGGQDNKDVPFSLFTDTPPAKMKFA